jgi:hypothetical protein
MELPGEADYREWDEARDSAGYLFRRPPAAALSEVRPLEIDYARRLWQWVFPTRADVVPLVAKDSSGWLKDVLASPPVWYGRPGDPPLVEQLRRLFPWAAESPVFFLVRCGTGYQTTWEQFLKQLRHFLGWTEEGVLIHPTAREVAAFWEVSAMFVGRRSNRRLTSRL